MSEFPYTLVRSKRKSVSLVVKPDATVVVRVPFRISAEFVGAFVDCHEEWVRRAVDRMRALASRKTRRYVDGELFRYLGEQYPLRISESGKLSVDFMGGEFVLLSRFLNQANGRFRSWYRREAKKVLTERVAFYARKHGLVYGSIRINAARTRWGSCSGKGNLNFTFRLVMAPLSVIDYVVAHELAHLVHPNHSKKFWHVVTEICPGFARERQWLKENGHLLEC
ncbi:MAG: M48 family metallopeptidase [Candidatus Moraniibacteriota bacterium]|nr:MAG: M48 family metallopeptidase [Candidatus Moranbacteria bacterium]